MITPGLLLIITAIAGKQGQLPLDADSLKLTFASLNSSIEALNIHYGRPENVDEKYIALNFQIKPCNAIDLQ